ncbi:MAG: AAA+ family ATPase [Rhodobacteraceae bacterium]|nr:AAA+ family ATPase [Paracoccaceae bacterium]MCP5341829.1 AAA+ family ATPase [Paracoccaceae bacterium]
MKTIATSVFATLLCLAPAHAQGTDGSVDEGFSLLEEGAKIIMRSMLDEMEPALKDLKSDFGDALADMGPALRDLAGQIGDIRNYHPPVKLPNGDIIIRRKTPQELAEPAPGGQIEI